MTSFKNLEGLQQFLEQDAKTFSLNPVRFINVDSMLMWVEVKKLLLSFADETMPLSKFCEGMDTTPNINRMCAALKRTHEAQFISPLSELLRIMPEQAEQTIIRIIKTDYQNNDNGRLRFYFLMYRMKSLLSALPLDDPRAKDCVALVETNEESDYKLTIIQKDLDVKLTGNEIDGFKNYLQYWEANPDKPLILHTNNAMHFERNHFFDDVRVIVTSYDLIKYQYGLPSGVREELGNEDNWNDLLKAIVKEGSFEEACCSLLSINKYTVVLFERWSSFNAFQKWLLWLWARQQSAESYDIMASQAAQKFSEYLDELYCLIVKFIHDDRFVKAYKERKQILSFMKAVPTERFWKRIASLDKAEALSCLTCLSDIEQKSIFEIIADFDYQDRNRILPGLKIIYPQLYYYLNNDEQPNIANLLPEHEQYFNEYKWLKATDTISEGFVSKVKRIAEEKGTSVFQMQARNTCVTQHYDEHTAILFVDGLGIEYVDYLAHIFGDLDEKQYAIIFEAGYCSLPSITEINKDFLTNRNTIEPPVRELDELKHSNNVHPESLIKQLRILDDIKNRVLGLLIGDTRRIIIASDHGTSRMAVKVRNSVFDEVYPKPEKASVYKYGRFCEEIEDEAKYPTAIHYNEKLVFADYSRFIQNGAPIDEIHGGASLEEWLVPIITVERTIDRKSEPVEVEPKFLKCKPEIGTKLVNVSFTISGKQRNGVFARVKGRTYRCEYNQGMYSFAFASSNADTKLTVTIMDNGVIGTIDVEVEQGIKKNSNFDI